MFDRTELNYLRGRVVDLERQLEAERAENRRVERHWADMFLRRLNTYPVPPVSKSEPVQQPQPMRQISDSDLAKYEAIVAEGKRVGAQYDEIEKAVKQQIGLTPKELAEAIKASGVQ